MARHYYGQATAAVFAPLEPRARSEIVSRRLGDAIALGILPDGVQLPGEIDLAAAYGVSTATIREALSVLRHEGLIQTRRGRRGGSFVRARADAAETATRRHLARLSVVELRDLADLYATVAGGAAALAARRAGSDDLVQLAEAADAFAAAPDAGARRRADARLRVLLAVAAQSSRLFRAEVDLQSEIGVLLWLVSGDDATHADDVAEVRATVDAVSSADPEVARAAVERRLASATARLIEHRIALTDEPTQEPQEPTEETA
ncbi:MAG: GntR family transcriptional regulator [Nocardioides sp.]|uniref:FadR/GntR family transcriptional regulator n=1 Tax=Nocardioides sp. TaxID=35761 RepID=UPI0039E36BFF